MCLCSSFFGATASGVAVPVFSPEAVASAGVSALVAVAAELGAPGLFVGAAVPVAGAAYAALGDLTGGLCFDACSLAIFSI